MQISPLVSTSPTRVPEYITNNRKLLKQEEILHQLKLCFNFDAIAA